MPRLLWDPEVTTAVTRASTAARALESEPTLLPAFEAGVNARGDSVLCAWPAFPTYRLTAFSVLLLDESRGDFARPATLARPPALMERHLPELTSAKSPLHHGAGQFSITHIVLCASQHTLSTALGPRFRSG